MNLANREPCISCCVTCCSCDLRLMNCRDDKSHVKYLNRTIPVKSEAVFLWVNINLIYDVIFAVLHSRLAYFQMMNLLEIIFNYRNLISSPKTLHDLYSLNISNFHMSLSLSPSSTSSSLTAPSEPLSFFIPQPTPSPDILTHEENKVVKN